MKKYALLFLLLALALAGCGKSFVAIIVAPSSASLALGGTQQFSATVLFSDGSTSDVSTQATWTSSDTSVATIDASGLATGLASGLTNITANLGPLTSNTVALSVANPLASIAITPASASLEVGQTQQFSATGTYQNGATADLTSAVAWASSDESVATIDASGLANALAAGSTSIRASLDSVASNEASLQATALPTATLSTSVSTLALAVSGVTRSITLTNTSLQDSATDVQVTGQSLPSGTFLSSTCAPTLIPGGSCQIFLTPGAMASPPNTAPAFGSVSVQGSNTNALSIPVGVLTEGNIYQGGYIFSLDDSTPTTGSVGGKAAALADNSFGIAWTNGPTAATGAVSLTDGQANTAAIVAALGAGVYAAAVCNDYEIDSADNAPCQGGNTCYTDWYLPAICEMGGAGEGAGCSAGSNMSTNLLPYDPSLNSNIYWSSTEAVSSSAWTEFFDSTNGSLQLSSIELITHPVRCARMLTP